MFQVDSRSPTPLYAQLDRAIRAAIASGQINQGDKLPTVRQMAVDLRINANTVAKVYAELERAGVLAGAIPALSPRVAKQWERGVVLRLGKYRGLEGPGIFWIVPLIDSLSSWIDQRVITTNFAAEETLTMDTVPVNVDAVLFWMVHDSEKAALEVQDYTQAVSWAAQTGLRDIIGRTSLSELLRGRERIESELQALIDQRSNPWGVTVQAVEMRDVIIRPSLQGAMSREGHAPRAK